MQDFGVKALGLPGSITPITDITENIQSGRRWSAERETSEIKNKILNKHKSKIESSRSEMIDKINKIIKKLESSLPNETSGGTGTVTVTGPAEALAPGAAPAAPGPEAPGPAASDPAPGPAAPDPAPPDTEAPEKEDAPQTREELEEKIRILNEILKILEDGDLTESKVLEKKIKQLKKILKAIKSIKSDEFLIIKGV